MIRSHTAHVPRRRATIDIYTEHNTASRLTSLLELFIHIPWYILCSLHTKFMLPTATVHVKLNFLANVTLDVYTELDLSSSGSNFTLAVMVLSTAADKEPLTEGFLKPNLPTRPVDFTRSAQKRRYSEAYCCTRCNATTSKR